MDSTVNRESDMGLAALPLSREQGQVEAGLEDGKDSRDQGFWFVFSGAPCYHNHTNKHVRLRDTKV